MAGKIIIIGCGAQARYIINTISLIDGPEIIGLIDTFDNPAIWGKSIDGVPVLGNLDVLQKHQPTETFRIITAIADLPMKRKVVKQLKDAGYAFYTAIHPYACIARNVIIGEGTIINAHVTIETGTTIGSNVIVHAGCVIEHDNVLEDYVNLGPGVVTAGRVRIKNGAIVYTGASIIPNVFIGENAIIGAGAVVTKSIDADTKVIGVPAKPIKSKSDK